MTNFRRGLLAVLGAAWAFPNAGARDERQRQSPKPSLRQWVTLEEMGAVGDGAADDTSALSRALLSGRRIRLSEGAVYRVTSAQATPISLYVVGNGTITFAFAGIGILCTGPVIDCTGVTFDGDGRCHRPIQGAGQAKVALTSCTIQNVYGTGKAGLGITAGVRFDSPRHLRIANCTFTRIRALADGIEGNDGGAVRAIYLRGAVESAVIQDCHFEDVNSQDASGRVVSEDADAIHGQSISGAESQVIVVRNCHFTNCGKRAAKFQAGRDSISKFVGNTVISSWTIPAVQRSSVNDSKAMYAVVSVYGGILVYSENVSAGGVISYMVQGNDSVADVKCVQLVNNVHTPLHSPYGFTNHSPTRMQIATSNPRGTGQLADVLEVGNYYTGLYGWSLLSIRDFVTVANYQATKEGAFRLDTVRNLSAVGNIQLASASGTSEFGYQFVTNQFASVAFAGNVLTGFYDAVYFGTPLNGGSFKVSLCGNVFGNNVRNDVSEFTSPAHKANYVYLGNNTTKPSSDLNSVRSVTTLEASAGSAAALPLRPAAYETVTINANVYKRPLYA